jgi:hypothetical protein
MYYVINSVFLCYMIFKKSFSDIFFLENKKIGKKHILFFLLTCTIAFFLFVKAVKRDIIYKNDYNGDLRNRVVGARLIYDGKLPYYYKWKVNDGIRYYDPQSFNDKRPSNITATPFFHELIMPLCNLPQSAIATIWLWVQYLMFLSVTVIALSFCKVLKIKFLVSCVALAFLFTDAWKAHVAAGQIYIFTPFFLSLLSYFLYRAKKLGTYLFCGVIAAALILLRPNFILFFLPLFFLLKKFGVKNILALILPFLIAILFICLSTFQSSLWKGYFSAVNEHILIHQNKPYEKVQFDLNPGYTFWEGISCKTPNNINNWSDIIPHSENGNFFVLVNLFHRKISSEALFISSTLLILLLFLIFYKSVQQINFHSDDLKILLLTGFCFYMISDLFSPVYRHQYYTVQWLFPVLLFFSVPKNKAGRITEVLVMAGVFLNISNIAFLKMQHTIGEYLILVSLLFFSLTYFKQMKIER